MKKLLENKTVSGFFLPLTTVIISVVAVIVYGVGFTGTVYLNGWVIALPLVASAAFIALSLIKPAQAFASLVSGVLQFVALLMFILVSYMYLSEAFFGGVNMAAIIAMNKAWPVTFILLLVNTIFLNIGVYHSQERSVQHEACK